MDRELKLNPVQRATKIAALKASGMTHAQIASELHVSLSTIKRAISDLKPTIEEAKDIVTKYASKLDELYPVEERSVDYVNQAKSAVNEAVRMQARMRIDDLCGVVTEKERVRYKGQQAQGNQPLFIFPAGANIEFGPVSINKDVDYNKDRGSQ